MNLLVFLGIAAQVAPVVLIVWVCFKKPKKNLFK